MSNLEALLAKSKTILETSLLISAYNTCQTESANQYYEYFSYQSRQRQVVDFNPVFESSQVIIILSLLSPHHSLILNE